MTLSFRAPDSIAAFSMPWQLEVGRPVHVVVVKACADLVDGGPARLREPDPPSGDRFEGGSLAYPSDFSLPKRAADVVVFGHAHPPSRSTRRMEARLQLVGAAGRIDRRLAVFGRRAWQGNVPGEPRAIDAPIPLVWEEAFGGPGSADNPVGRGSDGRELPRLEDPRDLIVDRDSRPRPIGLGAIPWSWPARSRHLGHYDGAWLENRFPYFASDLDPAFFQVAPSEQRLTELVGDERYLLSGLDPEMEVLSGRLPGLRPRCFAVRESAELDEVAMALDTLIFADERRVHLVWRGVVAVADERATDVVEMFVTLEALGEMSDPLAQYRLELALELGEAPEMADEPANDAGAEPGGLGAVERRIRERLTATGVPIAPIEARPEVVRPEAPPEPGDAAGRARVEAALAAGTPLEGMELSRANLSGLDLSGQSLAGADLRRARLVGTRLVGAQLNEAQLAGADLTDALLGGACLDLADLEGAVLEGADLSAASLVGASLAGAAARGARFDGAVLDCASLRAATLAEVSFRGARLVAADLTEADLGRASFDEADLTEARLYDAQAGQASFRGATLGDLRADGAALAQAVLEGARADGAVLDGADLCGLKARGASLRGAGLASVRASRADLRGADLASARLRDSSFDDALLAGANLMEAALDGCHLRRADLRGANLYGAELWRADLGGARLDEAFVANTKIGGRR